MFGLLLVAALALTLAAGSATNTTDAFRNFTISLIGQGDVRRTVFEDRELAPEWMPPAKDNATDEELARMYHDDVYTDRVQFGVSFGSGFFDSHVPGEPTVSSSDDSVCKPSIIDYRNDVDEKEATFAIAYDCRYRPGDAARRGAIVSVVVPVMPGVNILFALRKTCGGGKHTHLQFGVYRDEKSRVTFAQARGYIAGPHELSTRIFVHLRPPARTQEFFRPRIVAADPRVVALTVRGPALGGVLRAGESEVLHVLYECRRAGVTRISALVPVSPFRPLRATWTKDCGGGRPHALTVGSVRWDDAVVHAGVVDDAWTMRADELQRPGAMLKRGLHTFNESARFADLFLTNDGDAMRLGPATFSVDRPDRLALYEASPPASIAALFVAPTRGEIAQGERKRLRIMFVCRRRGVAHVLVSLPLHGYAPLEFGFRKVCPRVRRAQHRAFLRTAGSFMTISMTFMVFVMVYSCFRTLRGAPEKAPALRVIPVRVAVTQYQNPVSSARVDPPRQPPITTFRTQMK